MFEVFTSNTMTVRQTSRKQYNVLQRAFLDFYQFLKTVYLVCNGKYKFSELTVFSYLPLHHFKEFFLDMNSCPILLHRFPKTNFNLKNM